MEPLESYHSAGYFIKIYSHFKFKGNIPLILALSYGNSRLVIAYIMSTKKVAKKNGIGYMFYKSNPKKYVLFGGIGYVL